MSQRFLNNNDYMSQISDELFNQLIRGQQIRVEQAEEAAEASIVEYLTDNYEVEKALQVGKNLREYNSRITYPVGVHFYYEGKIVEALRSINGIKAPASKEYWREYEDFDGAQGKSVSPYSQLMNYRPGDLVFFSGTIYECMEYNGLDYADIRIPGIIAWETVEVSAWEPNLEYELWSVVEWEGQFFALISLDDIDLTVNPMDSDNWGLIGKYDPEYEYEFKDTEYVEFDGKVWIPTMTPTADKLVEGYNFRYNDPRNTNLKKHMVKIALYELHKLISPNNVSSARITDYEATMQWLHDANRCKINPQIPRKMDEEKKPVSEIAIATFQSDYDPRKNPWQI
jgi:hypothetical protein